MSGERQALLRDVPLDEFLESRLEDGHLSPPEHPDLRLILVHADHVVAGLRQARTRNQAHVPAANDCQPHENALPDRTRRETGPPWKTLENTIWSTECQAIDSQWFAVTDRPREAKLVRLDHLSGYHTSHVMRILLDYRPALRQRTGVGEWVHELARSLLQLRRTNAPPARDLDLVIWSASFRDRLDTLARKQLDGARFVDRRIPVRPLIWAWNRLNWPPVEALAAGQFDVVHATTPLLVPSRAGLRVCTIYDLDFLQHPDRTWGEMRRDFPSRVRDHVRRADLVVTISEHSSRQIQTCLDVPPERIVVCPPGVPAWAQKCSTAPREPGRGYLLFVGTLEPRKNIVGLLDAYEKLVAAVPAAPKLVLAGGATEAAGPWIQRAQSGPLRGRVDIRGYVRDTERPALYAGAAALVLPSFEEGFGLPALEAMALGVPVIASTRGALPEVIGKAGLLADPGDAEAFATLMRRVLGEDGLAARMRTEGLDRARRFDWRVSAAHLLEAFRNASPSDRRAGWRVSKGRP